MLTTIEEMVAKHQWEIKQKLEDRDKKLKRQTRKQKNKKLKKVTAKNTTVIDMFQTQINLL